MSLTPADFPEFYTQVHGHPPFPWQRDLVTQVMEQCAWPDLVDVPTGLGKTSMLDASVFIAAATAHRPGAQRLGRRRTFFVVDRRIVVDEAWEHAKRIAGRLEAAHREGDDGVLGAVAAGLRAFCPEDPAGALLRVTRMRGGATWAASWLDRPDQAGLIVGTVDQVGSRLLFRGYGVSDRRRPIDAALTGTDALLLVDEAHLAEALVSTVSAAHVRDHSTLDLPRTDVVRLTATAGSPVRSRYRLDVAAHRGDQEAWRRLTAGKALSLLQTPPRRCEQAMAELATRFAGESANATVLVVCNTVNRARAVHQLLNRETDRRRGGLDADLWLLIGRSRPIDREHLIGEVLERFGVGRDRAAHRRPAVLVATQTVEVGANLDADDLISESASWDALVQRLGRLNRLGRHEGSARAVVVHDGVGDGPVYGAARDAAWDHLLQLSSAAPASDATALEPDRGLDVSPLACRELTEQMPEAATLRRPQSPVLQTATLDAWVATAPVPMLDPPIDVFLHGFDSGRPGVGVAWRDGLVDAIDDAELDADAANALLQAVPVRADELVEVPFLALRRWAAGETVPAVDDLESSPDPEMRAPQNEREAFEVLLWRTDGRPKPGAGSPGTAGRWVWGDSTALRPGDTVVIPTERGGLDRYGWAPGSKIPVGDVAEVATLRRNRPVLRLDHRLADRLGLAGEAGAAVAVLARELRSADRLEEQQEDPTTRVIDVLTEALADRIEQLTADDNQHQSNPEDQEPVCAVPAPSPRWPVSRWRHLLAWLSTGPRLVRVSDPADLDGRRVLQYLLTGGRRVDVGRDGGDLVDSDVVERDDEDPGASSINTQPVTLEQHHTNVGQRARQIAAALRLPPDVARVVEDAARWHDLGKTEPRFQIMLHGGDGYQAALATEPLAKSGMAPHDRPAWAAARRASGLPDGARHEAWSAALVEQYLTEHPYPGDVDLLIHLVASHHGHARPWLPLVIDNDPRAVEAALDGTKVQISSEQLLSLDHPARFARLNDRYGRWGLALLETVVRCADMTVSAEGS